jgi:hypothetical protein
MSLHCHSEYVWACFKQNSLETLTLLILCYIQTHHLVLHHYIKDHLRCRIYSNGGKFHKNICQLLTVLKFNNFLLSNHFSHHKFICGVHRNSITISKQT